MKHEFQYTFSEEFLRAALRRDVLWRGYVAAGLLLLIPVVVRLGTSAWPVFMTWLCPLAAAGFIAGIHMQNRVLARRTYEGWLKSAPDHVMRFRLDDEGFEVVLANGHARYAWTCLRRLWRYPDVWMLEIAKMQSAFFPPDAASDEARAFIVERCAHAGVRS